jgi:flagellar M-ring protein FliF
LETGILPENLAQVQAFLKGLSLRQKLLLVAGAAVVALTLWAFVTLFDKGKNVTLYSGLRSEDAQALGAKLSARNIPFEISPDGTSVLVPAEKLDAARLETASQGLPRNARLGFELFDNPNWAGSDFSEKVNYQRALEGELERTLQTLNDVEAVRVHLVMSRESLFTEQEHEAKAAVIVKTRGGTLSREAQQAIPQLVASAVDRLRPGNVTVVDADTATPFIQKNAGSGRLSFNSDEELAAAAVHAIEPVVGAEHVRASVHVEYDLSTSEDTSEIYDPKSAVAVSQQHSEEIAGGGAPGGVPGTASNLSQNGAPNTAIVTAMDNQSSKSESTTYAVNRSTKHVMQPAGRVRRITAAILVDDAVESNGENGKTAAPARRKRSPEEMTAIEKLARAAIGVDEQRGDLLAVENLSFQTMPSERLAAPTRFERVRQVVQPWTHVLRYLGITFLFLIVYALVLRPVKKQALEAFRQIPAQIAKASQPLPAGEAANIELPTANEEGTRAALIRKQLIERIKAEPSAASRLVQSWIREPKKQG